MLFSGGCCCCDISDTFDRDDSSDIGDEWEVVSGTWEIFDNQLVGTGPGLVIWQTENPRGADDIQSASIMLDDLDGGEVFRLVVGYTDPDNYLAVEYKRAASNDGELSIVTRAAGIETKETWAHLPTRTEETPALFVCLRPAVGATPATLTAMLRRTSGKHRWWHRDIDIAVTPGLLGGLEIISGTINFNDWSFGSAYDYFDSSFSLTQRDPPCFDPEPKDCGNQDPDVSVGIPIIDFLYGGSFANGQWTDGFMTFSASVHNRGDMAFGIGVTTSFATSYIAFNAVDADNHYAVLSNYTAGLQEDTIRLRIVRVEGGAMTTLEDETFTVPQATVPFFYTIGVCVSEDTISAYSYTNALPVTRVEIQSVGLMPFDDGWYFGFVALTTPIQFNIAGANNGSPYDSETCVPCDHDQQ